MNWLDKLERKFGRYAIPNLTVYLLVAYVIGFGIVWMMPDLVGYITLEPALILRGQVWRLITWILVPPTTNMVSLLFLVLLCPTFSSDAPALYMNNFREFFSAGF